MTATATALPIRHVEHCMGTVFSFRIETPGVPRAVLDEVVAWLHHVDRTFSTYRPDSVISRINAGTLVRADSPREVQDVLAACDRARDATDGYFDAYYDRPTLDPSGYVKGWAVQGASDRLRAAGSTNHCVNGGGDVACVGRAEPDRLWRVGIADPHRPGQLLHTLTGEGPLAVATSGLAERGAHIVDPHFATAATDLAAVTVVADDLVRADVCATAAVAMGPGRCRQWLAAQDGVRAVIVHADASVATVGFPDS